MYSPAAVTPAADSGGATLHVPIAVKFNSDVCGVFGVSHFGRRRSRGDHGRPRWRAVVHRVRGPGRPDHHRRRDDVSEFISINRKPAARHNGRPRRQVWFTENGTSRIAQEVLSGGLNEVSVPTSASYPVGITAGSDGNLWFVEFDGNNVGRFTTPSPRRSSRSRRWQVSQLVLLPVPTGTCGSPKPSETISAGSRPPDRSPNIRFRRPRRAR